MNVWTLKPEDSFLIGRIEESMEKFLQDSPPGFVSEFIMCDKVSFTPEENGVNYVIGYSIDFLLGYATCERAGPGSDVGDISFVMQERYGGAYDEGVVVNKDRLKIYPGYSNYRGRGELLLISLVESFYPMQGNGTQLLRFIQGQEFELIEGLPKGEGVADFLIKCGFVHTGLKNRDGFSVMVWSNPEFEED